MILGVSSNFPLNKEVVYFKAMPTIRRKLQFWSIKIFFHIHLLIYWKIQYLIFNIPLVNIWY